MNNKTPKLRFKGFTDAWEQRKFVETFDFLPNNSLSRAQLTYENGTVKNVHYGDVLIKFWELLDVGKEELPYLIDDSLIKNYSSAVLKNGDVVIADAAEDETVGKCSEIKGIKDEKILSGLHTIPVRPRFEFENGYLGYFMNSHSYHDQLLPLIQGTKVSSISKKVLENTVISYPASSSEQEKIATFFENLTNLITLHQRKLEKIKSLKKAYLDKMFPKKGKLYPELRFAGFTDAWEQRKLIDVCDYVDYRGKTPAKTDAGIFLVTAKNVKKGYIDYETSKEYISEENYEEVMHRGKPKIGDVLITTEAPCGNVAQVNTTDIALAQRIIKYRGHENLLDNTYLKHYLLSPVFQRVLDAKSSGGTVQGIKGSVLHQQEIMFPNFNEQVKIGKCLDNLDNLITLHQRKLEKLKQLKTGYLNSMFI